MNLKTKYTAGDIARAKATADMVGYVKSRVAIKRSSNGEWVGCCPFHAETTGSFYVIPSKRMFHCFGCGATGDIFEWLKRAENLTFSESMERILGGYAAVAQNGHAVTPVAAVIDDPEARARAEADQKKKIERAQKIWGESVPYFGTPVVRYLASRGITGMVLPPMLRFHPRLWNAEVNGHVAGMVACVVDARGKFVGIHRTYLKPDGSGKADVRAAKKMLGATHGGYVRLYDPVLGTLAIAEGIETALSIRMAMPNMGVWAALTLGNLGAPLPTSVREVILCADADNKDPRAAEAQVQKAARAHMTSVAARVVRIARPPQGKDFNDLVRG